MEGTILIEGDLHLLISKVTMLGSLRKVPLCGEEVLHCFSCFYSHQSSASATSGNIDLNTSLHCSASSMCSC